MSDVKPIGNVSDYDAAVEEVAGLWGSKLVRPKGDRLDVLATLIDAYEAQHHPIDPPDPIEAIKFRMASASHNSISRMAGLPYS